MRDQRPQQPHPRLGTADGTQSHDRGVADGAPRVLQPCRRSGDAAIAVGREGVGGSSTDLRIGVLEQMRQPARVGRRPDSHDVQGGQAHRGQGMAEAVADERHGAGQHHRPGCQRPQSCHQLVLLQKLDQIGQHGDVPVRRGPGQGHGHEAPLGRRGDSQGAARRFAAGRLAAALMQEPTHQRYGRPTRARQPSRHPLPRQLGPGQQETGRKELVDPRGAGGKADHERQQLGLRQAQQDIAHRLAQGWIAVVGEKLQELGAGRSIEVCCKLQRQPASLGCPRTG